MLTTYILASLILTGGTFVGAVCGFGGGIFAMSLLVMFIDLRLACVAFALAALGSSIWLGWTIRKDMPVKPVTFVVIGRAIGVTVGAQLLVFKGLDIYATLLLTVIIIGMAAKELIRPDKGRDDLPHEIKVPPALGSGIGLLSGIMNGWINMGGPPLILFSYRAFDGKAARRFLITVFLMTFPIQLTAYAIQGLFTAEAFMLFLAMIPGAILGTVSGHFFQKHIKKDVFIKVAWVTLLILGIILGVNTFFGKKPEAEDGSPQVNKSTSSKEGTESPETEQRPERRSVLGGQEEQKPEPKKPKAEKRPLETPIGEELEKER